MLGVDASPEMITSARARVPSARFEVLQSGRIPIGDAAFDTILSVWVLQYFVTEASELETISRELARVLAPGGRLVAIEQVQYGELERGGSLEAYCEGFAAAGFRTRATAVRVSHSRIVGRAVQRPRLATLPGLASLVRLEAGRVRPDLLVEGRYADYLFVGSR